MKKDYVRIDENNNSDNDSNNSSDVDENDFWLLEERNHQLRKNKQILYKTSRNEQLKLKTLSILHSPLPLMKFSPDHVIRKPATTFLGKNIKFIDSNVCNIGIDNDDVFYKRLAFNLDVISVNNNSNINKDNSKLFNRSSNNNSTNINQKDNIKKNNYDEKNTEHLDFLYSPLHSHQLKPWFQTRCKEELTQRQKENKRYGDTSTISTYYVYQSDIFSKLHNIITINY